MVADFLNAMVPKTYSSMHLAVKESGNIVPGRTFNLQQHDTPAVESLKEGQVFLQPIYLGIDAASRNWLKDQSEDGYRSYLPPVQIGEVMRGNGVGRVIASKSEKFPIGSHAYAMCGWTEISVLSDKELIPFKPSPQIGMTDMLSVYGVSGLCAYFGLIEVGEVKAGDNVVVSAAAGSVGSIAGQIAKAKGANVVGIAGSDEKCRWIKQDLGFDEALNYKDSNFKKNLIDATPNFIDLYYDNVGGEILDLCFSRAAEHSRFVICGSSSQYNEDVARGPANFSYITSMRISVRGFITSDYMAQFPAAQGQLGQWVAEGKIKTKDTIFQGGVGEADKALASILTGVNTGKMMVQVRPEADSAVGTPTVE